MQPSLVNEDYHVIEQKTLAETKWISFKTITYTDRHNVQRGWDMCERATAIGQTVAAVDVLAVLKKKGEPDRLVIEIQYRYYCFHFY